MTISKQNHYCGAAPAKCTCPLTTLWTTFAEHFTPFVTGAKLGCTSNTLPGGYVKTAKTKEKNASGEENFI